MSQQKLLKKVIHVLERYGIDYMMTGSIVSSLQGEPRATHDIDIVIQIHEASITALVTTFQPPRFYLTENSIKDAIQFRSMFNLLDTTEGDKIDFWILTDDPFDKSRFERKYSEDVFGFTMKVSSPEDTILAKLRWAKLSGGSEKQLIDAIRVFEVQYGRLDLAYLEAWANKLDLHDQWNELKKNANPI